MAINNRHDFHAFSAFRCPNLCPATLRHHERRVDEAFFFIQRTSVAKLVSNIGEATPTIIAWTLDTKNYRAIPTMSDGTGGAPLDLRPLFERFNEEAVISAPPPFAITNVASMKHSSSSSAPLSQAR